MWGLRHRHKLGAGIDASLGVGIEASCFAGIEACLIAGIEASLGTGMEACPFAGVEASLGAGIEVSLFAGIEASLGARIDASLGAGTKAVCPFCKSAQTASCARPLPLPDLQYNTLPCLSHCTVCSLLSAKYIVHSVLFVCKPDRRLISLNYKTKRI